MLKERKDPQSSHCFLFIELNSGVESSHLLFAIGTLLSMRWRWNNFLVLNGFYYFFQVISYLKIHELLSFMKTFLSEVKFYVNVNIMSMIDFQY